MSNVGVTVRGLAWPPENHAAIADSYAAVVANASAASWRRVSSESSPFSRSSASTPSYWSGVQTGGHVLVVLRGRPQHRRAADVDHLHSLLLAHAPAPGDLRERVEVHAHELERPDAELVERMRILLVVAAREDGRVHLRVERLHAPAEQLADAGQLLDERHAELVLLDEGRRAAARDQLHAELGEAARERVEPGLVVHGEERALDHSMSSRSTSGYRRCSTSCRRSRSSAGCRPPRSHPLLGDDRARCRRPRPPSGR